MSAHRSYGEVLAQRAAAAPDATAYTFLEDDGSEQTLTYAELHGRASAIATAIEAERRSPTEPALLLFAPGLDYIAALFGCFYAGTAAVPAFPPIPSRINRTLPRLLGIVEDSAADLVLTTTALGGAVEQWVRGGGRADPPRVVATDELADPDPGAVRGPVAIAPDALALLQYTSGSTSAPRGVMLTHDHLLSNSERIRDSFGVTSDDRVVIWLPPYHDMGLIGGVMQPIYNGMPCVLMSPITFLRHPIVWLREISRNRSTTTGGPNFAYDLCVRRTRPEEREGLDLSSWSIAFTGAEPVSAQTIEAFTATFGPYGFRREAFYPCYGLAEATLLVSGSRRAAPPRYLCVDRPRLEREGVVEVAGDDGDAATRVLVGCGTAPADHRAVIVDPATRRTCPDGHVGEIWFSGPSVAAGYWRRERETEDAFGAVTADTGEGPFLRTGDLGFLLDGEVFVTGRLKEVIIINGRNLYPLDVEKACEAAVASLRPSCGAVFAVADEAGGESLAVVYEVAGDDPEEHAAALDAVRRAVSLDFNLRPEAVVLVAPRTIPKTSSGKVQRLLCRQQFLSGELSELARWTPRPPRGAGARPASAAATTPGPPAAA